LAFAAPEGAGRVGGEDGIEQTLPPTPRECSCDVRLPAEHNRRWPRVVAFTGMVGQPSESRHARTGQVGPSGHARQGLSREARHSPLAGEADPSGRASRCGTPLVGERACQGQTRHGRPWRVGPDFQEDSSTWSRLSTSVEGSRQGRRLLELRRAETERSTPRKGMRSPKQLDLGPVVEGHGSQRDGFGQML